MRYYLEIGENFRRLPCICNCIGSQFKDTSLYVVGGAVASWLVRSTPERAVRVWALAGDIVLCSWARHFTLTVPLSTQVYKWVPANLMLGGNPAMDWNPIQGGVEILLVALCYRNRDKLRPGGPHWTVCRLYLSLCGAFMDRNYHYLVIIHAWMSHRDVRMYIHSKGPQVIIRVEKNYVGDIFSILLPTKLFFLLYMLIVFTPL